MIPRKGAFWNRRGHQFFVWSKNEGRGVVKKSIKMKKANDINMLYNKKNDFRDL